MGACAIKIESGDFLTTSNTSNIYSPGDFSMFLCGKFNVPIGGALIKIFNGDVLSPPSLKRSEVKSNCLDFMGTQIPYLRVLIAQFLSP